jgi:putative transposase
MKIPDNQPSLKVIVNAIEQYYGGKQKKCICKDFQIEHKLFNTWLEEYKHIAVELIELRKENEKLRAMFIDLTLKHENTAKNSKNESISHK